MEFADLQSKTIEELKAELKKVEKVFHALRLKALTKQLKAAHELREAKKTIARILTILRAK